MISENNYYIQLINSCVHHKRKPSVRHNKRCSNSIMRQSNYVQQTERGKLILIVLRRNVKIICNRTLYISKTWIKLPSVVIV